MNVLDRNMLERTLIEARKIEPVAGARVAAAISVNGNLFFGYNSRKTHPMMAKWGKNDKAICLHAEVDVIKNSLRHHRADDLSRATLYVARAKADGTPGLAKPCEGCARCIVAFGIKEVYWTE